MYLAQKASGLFKSRDLESLQEAANFINFVTGSEWCKSRFGNVSVRVKLILVEPKDIGNMVAIAIAYINRIVYTDKGLSKISTLHELAHIFNTRSETYYQNMAIDCNWRPKRKGHSSHGVLWARIFISLTKEFLPECANQLETAFRQYKVRY